MGADGRRVPLAAVLAAKQLQSGEEASAAKAARVCAPVIRAVRASVVAVRASVVGCPSTSWLLLLPLCIMPHHTQAPPAFLLRRTSSSSAAHCLTRSSGEHVRCLCLCWQQQGTCSSFPLHLQLLFPPTPAAAATNHRRCFPLRTHSSPHIIQSQLQEVLSAVAYADYPHAWPGLLEAALGLLTSNVSERRGAGSGPGWLGLVLG
jgi:hypothetical protein